MIEKLINAKHASIYEKVYSICDECEACKGCPWTDDCTYGEYDKNGFLIENTTYAVHELIEYLKGCK